MDVLNSADADSLELIYNKKHRASVCSIILLFPASGSEKFIFEKQ
jgi:hypothetical protein